MPAQHPASPLPAVAGGMPTGRVRDVALVRAAGARPPMTVAVMSAATLICFGVVGLWAGHGRQAAVSADAVVVEGGAARVVVHPGAASADPAVTAPSGAALPDGWPTALLPARFAVRSTGAVGNLLVVTGTLPRAEVDGWTSSLVGVWRVASTTGGDAASPVRRLSLAGGGLITVQPGDPALVEVILPG